MCPRKLLSIFRRKKQIQEQTNLSSLYRYQAWSPGYSCKNFKKPLTFQNKQCSTVEDTHYVHEGEEVVLNMFFAMEPDDRVVHTQQHLNVVVVISCMPASSQGFIQLLLYTAVQGTQVSKAPKKRLYNETARYKHLLQFHFRNIPPYNILACTVTTLEKIDQEVGRGEIILGAYRQGKSLETQ